MSTYSQNQQAVERFLSGPTICLNCGQQGSHYVPPSFGEEGFFTCEAGKKEDKDGAR